MEQNELRKLQLVQLEILEEIARVCDEYNIKYFLDYGTLLGAVRHKGFIPWDDDLDIGMLRDDYEKFCKVAPKSLNEKYCFQTWDTEKGYGVPFGKVRKKGTLYLEGKGKKLNENGIFVDVFPYDSAAKEEEAINLKRALVQMERVVLMKCRYKPWDDNGKVNLKKRIGYLYYQFKALFTEEMDLKKKYDKTAKTISEGDFLYCQDGLPVYRVMPKAWLDKVEKIPFEGKEFYVPMKRHEYLTLVYGDYMKLPPVEKRGNRHQIVDLKFGE